LHVSIEKNIGAFHVSVQNFPVMQCFEASDDLDKDIPYFLFLDVCFSLLVAANLLKDIAVVSVFHDQTTLL
jgi:hypothetical protein